LPAFHENLKVVDIPRKGKGVIVLADIPANTVIFEFKGNKFTRESMIHDETYVLQVGSNKFLGPSGDLDDYINHSCNPNCGLNIMGDRAFLFSIHLIRYGSEITFDYSTSSNDTLDQWKMECKCGDFKCRKVISGYQYLDKELKERYEKMGIVPSYLIGK
jgi:SET domain-containing protein